LTNMTNSDCPTKKGADAAKCLASTVSIVLWITVPMTKALTIKPRIGYWFQLSGKAKKTMESDDAGEKIPYNPDRHIGRNIVTGFSVTYVF
jgi:quinolinate synthase